ncbi:Gustatory and odorant receptor 22 [Eumeta japonica]|uniref:Gustatory and odorant receptor 22 n=1 Tax=Eumeta variegata TaxID=151549 RepID=A0A4C1VWF1_EUMVA|nr:Gustatory and odorant receptor 22 [Eumeta japonica]
MEKSNPKFRLYNSNQNEEFRKRDMFGTGDPIDVKELHGPQITDKDGALLDEHDSFYMTTKSLLVLFQIMGVMPIMRVPREAQTTKRTTYNVISKATLWAYLVWSLETIIVVQAPDTVAIFNDPTNEAGYASWGDMAGYFRSFHFIQFEELEVKPSIVA